MVANWMEGMLRVQKYEEKLSFLFFFVDIFKCLFLSTNNNL